MIPQLHKCAPALTIEFHLSIPSDVVTTLLLVRVARRYEGLDNWIYEVASALPETFLQELKILGYFLRWCFLGQDNLTWSLAPDHPAQRDFDAFLSYLESQPAAEYQQLARLNLRRAVLMGSEGSDLDETVSLTGIRSLLKTLAVQEVDRHGEDVGQLDVDAMFALFQDPESLRRQLLALLRTFWETYYRDELELNLIQMERCVGYHRRQDYPASFRDVFRRVTGRNMTPEMQADVNQHLGQVEQIFFVPSCHLGPYFLFIPDYPRLEVAFNYRLAPAAAPDVAETTELFPPFKALADETRLQIVALLQGRELYAQEIVEALNLSQPTVSRHLQLLERTEVVRVRRQNGMKYYTINREKGQDLIAALRPLLAE